MSFFGLDIAVSALRAQQQAMAVTGNNIANAGTAGYHRQEAVLIPSASLRTSSTFTGSGNPQLGTGVLVQTVRRVQSAYIENQSRVQNQALGNWNFQNESLKQVEAVLGEPGGVGLSSTLDKFFNSWEELAATPDSQTARISVVQAGVSLSDRIRSLYSNFRDLQSRVDRSVCDNVSEINRLAHEIAQINSQITSGSDSYSQPNALLDQRDMLADQLSNLVPIQVSGDGGLNFMISVGGKNLVQGGQVIEVTTGDSPSGFSSVVWTDDGTAVAANSGEVAGQIEVRDNVLAGFIDSLNTVATTIVSRVNELHTTGVLPNGNPCGDFFTTGTDASNISVDASLINAPAGVGAGTIGTAGDNSLASAMSGVRNERIIGNQTIGDTYGSLVASIGSQAREASTQYDVHNLSVQQLQTQRDSVSGVSLDEEMTNMVKFQQAYNAAARIVTVLDDMLDTLINKTGIG